MKFFLLLLFAASLFAQNDPHQVLATGEEYYDVAATGSMRPAITENHWVIIKKIPFKNVLVDDIIIYRANRPIIFCGINYGVICHRVVRKSSGDSIVITKGDANPEWDRQFVTEKDYVGTVIAVVRKE